MLKCLKFNCFILQIQKVKSLVLSRYPHSDPPWRLDEDDLTGKTSNRAVENNSESEQRTVPPQRRIWFHRTSASAYVVVKFLIQVIFVFLLFFGMVMYANEVETKEK